VITVILAGGLGTRLSEQTDVRPKPMVEVGGRPILWHIMNIYSAYGFNEFIVALGYKGEYIKEYFLRYFHASRDLTVELSDGSVTVHDGSQVRWRVHLVDTGEHSLTGGRLLRLRPWLGDKPFMVTYGDGVADINVRDLVAFHKREGRLATVAAVRPPARFGGISLDGSRVKEFSEKPQIGEGWINGGFFVMEPGVFGYIDGDESILERSTLERLTRDGQLSAYRHDAFWQCMDTLRDVKTLNELWAGGAPWKVW
jgi:glucose-1-phosphate cytidylyltransferase